MPLFSKIRSAAGEYRHVSVLGAGGLFFAFGNAAVWFLLPILAEKLFKDLSVVGLLIAIPSAIALFFDIPVGGLSDRLGRKKLFVSGLVVMSLLGLALPMVNTLARFSVFMLFFGFANLSIIVPVRAYIMDIAPKAKTAEFFGIFGAVTQIGFAVGPVIAGYLLAGELGAGIQNTGLFYFIMCAASAILLSLFAKETVAAGKSAFVSIREVITKDRVYYKSLLDYRDLHYAGIAILFSTFIIVSVDGIIWTLEPLYTTLGVGSAAVGVILSMFVVPFILFEVPAGFIADKFGKIRVFIAGLLVAGVFLMLFGSTQNPKMLAAYAFLATTGLAFARPAMDGFLTDISAKKQRGGIVGVWNVAEDAAYVASPIAGGFIAQSYGIGATFMMIGGLLVLSTPLIYSAIKKSRF